MNKVFDRCPRLMRQLLVNNNENLSVHIKVIILYFLVLFEQNDKGQCPVDVVPEPLDMPLEMADAAAQAKELSMLLRDVLPQPITPWSLTPRQTLDLHTEKAQAHLANLGIHLGDKVVIAGQKVPFILIIPFVCFCPCTHLFLVLSFLLIFCLFKQPHAHV